MITDASHRTVSEKQGAKRAPRAARPNLSSLEKLSSEDLQTLRLDEGARIEFDARVLRFSRSRSNLQTFDGEDVATMDDARYDQLSAAQAQQSKDGIAVVHFLAPRILRLRDSTAKRKWRSLLTKFRKDEKLI